MNSFSESWLCDYQSRLGERQDRGGERRAAGVSGAAAVAEVAVKPAHAEWDFQTTVAKFLDLALPVGAFWTSIDMGPARSKAVGGMRKARGLKAGVPDALIIWGNIALWLEIKTQRGQLSDAQKNVRAALLANGHLWALVRSIDDVVTACAMARIPLWAVG